MKQDIVALGIEVRGIVQGVGFRPFVHQLAGRFDLKGTVANTTAGVTIHLEGPQKDIDDFCVRLSNCPPLALITDITVKPEALLLLHSFSILPSRLQKEAATFISPDASVCNDCLLEMQDPQDRRFGYPFINCTHCGPRYSIIEDIPYDRSNTTMKHFSMCRRCRREYEDPSNRRFHAQPNACPECGPKVILFDNRQQPVATTAEAIRITIRLLKEGRIVAIKGLGGFHLAVDAQNQPAAAALRARKKRPDKPFALMSPSIKAIRRYARITADEEALISNMARPIVLLEKRPDHLLSPQVSPKSPYFGVMLPYTPLHYLLLAHHFTALIMTSGNQSNAPLCSENAEAFERLSGIADFFLVHDRPICQRNDDTLMHIAGGKARFIRRARGAVPAPVQLAHPVPPTLACGGELKNTVCLARGKTAFLSQHLGNMGEMSVLDFYKDVIEHLKKITRIVPEIVAHDLHPDYLSTRYAEALPDVRHIGVQHHHAHAVSCMAENGLDGPVIGLVLDGTGYGTDGAIWGGEVMITERARFTRAAHLSYIPMPGGEAAIKEPWRMAVSYLYEAFGKDMESLSLPFLTQVNTIQYRAVLEMISKRLHSPGTSSIGRLFDGVAAMLGLCHHATFEAQAAMALEASAGGRLNMPGERYDWNLCHSDNLIQIEITPLIRQIALELSAGQDVSQISRKFHRTLIYLFSDLCVAVRKNTGIRRIVMSGGVFQNKHLFEGLSAALRKEGFDVFSHHRVPTNDGGISLGQAVAAAASIEEDASYRF